MAYTQEELAILEKGGKLGFEPFFFETGTEVVIGVESLGAIETGKKYQKLIGKVVNTEHEGKTLHINVWNDQKHKELNPIMFSLSELKQGIEDMPGALAARLPGARLMLKARAVKVTVKDGITYQNQNFSIESLVAPSPYVGSQVTTVNPTGDGVPL